MDALETKSTFNNRQSKEITNQLEFSLHTEKVFRKKNTQIFVTFMIFEILISTIN